MKERKNNKLKKFAIAGGAICLGFVAGVGLTHLGFRNLTDINMKDMKFLIGKDKDTDTLLYVAKHLMDADRAVLIETYGNVPTVAAFFGDMAEQVVANNTYGVQLDDLVVNSIYTIAKKTET